MTLFEEKCLVYVLLLKAVLLSEILFVYIPIRQPYFLMLPKQKPLFPDRASQVSCVLERDIQTCLESCLYPDRRTQISVVLKREPMFPNQALPVSHAPKWDTQSSRKSLIQNPYNCFFYCVSLKMEFCSCIR